MSLSDLASIGGLLSSFAVLVSLSGGVPASVAYCNLSDCLRVYTDPQASAPLRIEVAGQLNGGLVLAIGGSYYFQNSGRPVEPVTEAADDHQALPREQRRIRQR